LTAFASNSSTQNIGVTGNATGSGSVNTIGVRGSASGANINVGVYAATSGAATTNTALQAVAIGSASALSRGVYASSQNDIGSNFGVYALAVTPTPGVNYGIHASAASGASNYAGWFSGDVHITNGNLTLDLGDLNVPGGSSNFEIVNIQGALNATAGTSTFFDVIVNDITITGTHDISSDKRLKKNINTLSASLSNLQKIRGTSYYW